MWPELWLLSLVPILAIVPLADTFLRVSGRVSAWLGLKHADKTLLALTCAIGIGLVLFLLPTLKEIRFGIIDYASVRDIEEATRERGIEKIFILVDFLFIASSIVATTLLAVRQRRSLAVWFLMSIIGNLGSVAWLIVNKRAGR